MFLLARSAGISSVAYCAMQEPPSSAEVEEAWCYLCQGIMGQEPCSMYWLLESNSQRCLEARPCLGVRKCSGSAPARWRGKTSECVPSALTPLLDRPWYIKVLEVEEEREGPKRRSFCQFSFGLHLLFPLHLELITLLPSPGEQQRSRPAWDRVLQIP